MKGLESEASDQWLIGQFFGSDHPFFTLNKETIIHTWITLGCIAALLLIGRYTLKKKSSLGRFTTLSFVNFFVDLYSQTLPVFNLTHLTFIATTFCFILACNCISIIPGMEEPTRDLNTTLALGIIAFAYSQWASIKTFGLWNYFKGYFSPFFVMMPLNVIGKLATVVSISFRLFGNIFGGSIIANIYFGAIKGNLLFELLGLMTGINLLITVFFGIFEGFIQAFIFAMLSLTYLSMAIQGEGH